MAAYSKGAEAHDMPLASHAAFDEALHDRMKSTDADKYDMLRLGKEQEMKRNFKSATMFGFSVVLMGSWEAILSTATLGLQNGGSAGFLYTNLATWIGFLAVYASMGELGSMAPTSGGQYHWVSEFAPRKYQRGLSYIVGWLGVLGWQVGVAFPAFLGAGQLQALAVLNYPDYIPQRWHVTLIMIAILLICVIFTTFLAQKLHIVEGVIMALHIAGFFGILITLWVTSSKASSKEVWTSFYDPGWGSQGLSSLIGIVASVAPLLGADASAHMAEELQDAACSLPRTIVWAVVANGAMMFILAITLCYCIGDLDSVLATPTGFPYIQILLNSTGSAAATTGLASIIIVLGIAASITIMAGSSRQLFAFARDQGLPFSAWVSKINRRFDTPVNAIIVSFAISIIFALINLGSSLAFNIITSLGTATLTASYIICISCILWRRLTSQPLLPSRFDMGPRFGLAVNLLAVGWLCLVFVISFFPPVPEPLLTLPGMNWSVLVFAVVVLFSAVYFVVWGRKGYVGPVEYVRKLD